MNRNSLHHLSVVAVAVSSLLLTAKGSANTAPTTDLRQVGATSIVYRGPQLNVVVSYRFAKLNPAGNWLLLDTAMMSLAPMDLPRTAIAVRTPSGEVVPLASPETYNSGYRELIGIIARADAATEPINFLLPQADTLMGFFAEPGRQVASSSVWLDEWHNAYGRLFFLLPGGVQKGSYELLINLSQGQVAIPFTI